MNHNRFGPGEILVFIMLCLGFLLAAYPLFWMLMSSLKTSRAITGDIWALPERPLWSNYLTAWTRGVSGYFLNSFIVTAATVTGVLIISSSCAYGLSRYNQPWLNCVLVMVMGGMMLNPHVCLIPLYGLLRTLGVHNTRLALILPYTAFRLPLITLIVRAYFLGIPKEIEESACLDACNDFQIYSRLFVPMSRPVLATGAILVSYYAWNEFLFAIIFIDSKRLKTIPAGLMNFRDALQINWGPLLAGMAMSAMPLVIFFLFMQKYFIRGMFTGAVKG